RGVPRPSGDFFLGQFLEVHRGHAGLDGASQRGQNVVDDEPCAVHFLELFGTSQVNRHPILLRAALACPTSAARSAPAEPSSANCGQSRARAASLLQCSSDRKSTRLNSSHQIISYAVFCLKKKNTK